MPCFSLIPFRYVQALVTGCLLFLAGSGELPADTVSASPGPGTVDTNASRVFTFVDKTGFGHRHAIEGKLSSGTLLLGSHASAGELVFDMKSFDADTLQARRYLGLPGSTDSETRSQVNANMKGSDVLDVQRYPQAIFKVSSALATGNLNEQGLPIYELIGNFTLHGVTKPLRTVVAIEQARGWLHVRGNFAINQTTFGIKPFSKAFGAIGVADTLHIYGDLWVVPNDQVVMSEIPNRK